MPAADQIRKLASIAKHWSDHEIAAPRVSVFKLDSADRWEDWKFKITLHVLQAHRPDRHPVRRRCQADQGLQNAGRLRRHELGSNLFHSRNDPTVIDLTANNLVDS